MLTVRLSVPLSRSTTDWPAPRPLTLPPIVYRLGVQVTATLVTADVVTVPAPFATVHVLPAGLVTTVTL